VLAGGPRRTTQRRGYSFLPQRRCYILEHERVLLAQPDGIIVCGPTFTHHIPHPHPLYLYTTYTQGLYIFMEFNQYPQAPTQSSDRFDTMQVENK